jgi:archaea-specific DNA-binding protein
MIENLPRNEGTPNVDSSIRKENDNVIFIGGKPLVNYIRGVITQFTKWNVSEVVIKSRGKFISKAVDVAEISKRSLEDRKIDIKDIKIASESFETDGKKTNISTMDIILALQ